MRETYAGEVRLFVSVRPSAEAVAHLAAALGRSAVRTEQWHVTLAFLGEVASPSPLYDGLRVAAASVPVFDLRLVGSGAFDRQRAVWVGVGGGSEQLSALAAQVQQACRDAGVLLESRRFRPHLTVGRTGRVDPAALASYEGPSWDVREIELVHSVLGRTATHTVLERFPLAEGEQGYQA